MKLKASVTLLLSVCIAIFVAGCSSKLITITSKNWFDEGADYVPDKSEKTYTVEKGDSIELGGSCDLSITISSISDKEIVMKTNCAMSDKDDGSIDLRTTKTEFRVKKEPGINTRNTDNGCRRYFFHSYRVSKKEILQ